MSDEDRDTPMTTDRETEIADLLAGHEWYQPEGYESIWNQSAHANHQFFYLCAICLGDLDAIASVLAAYITDREAGAAAKALNDAADTLVSTTHMPDQGSADLEYAAKFMRQRARGLQANPFRLTPDTEGQHDRTDA